MGLNDELLRLISIPYKILKSIGLLIITEVIVYVCAELGLAELGLLHTDTVLIIYVCAELGLAVLGLLHTYTVC
jgi:hypothetical protein